MLILGTEPNRTRVGTAPPTSDRIRLLTTVDEGLARHHPPEKISQWFLRDRASAQWHRSIRQGEQSGVGKFLVKCKEAATIG